MLALFLLAGARGDFAGLLEVNKCEGADCTLAKLYNGTTMRRNRSL